MGYKQKKDIFSIRSAFDFFKDKAYLKEFMDKVLSNGFIAEFETKIVGNYGRVIDVLVSSNVIANLSDTTTSYVFIFRDITKRKKTEEELSKHNLRLVTLNAISITVSSTLNINEVLNSAIIKICEILEFECIRIYLLNSKKDELNLEAHHGHSSKFIGRDKIKNRQVGDGILGQTILTEKPFILDDIMESNNPYIDFIMKEGLRSSVYIPLISKGKPVGVMCVSTYSEFKFSEDYIDFLMAAGNQIGVAIENANLYKNIKATYQKMKRAQEQVIRSEKLASLGKLAATIAHEINNPLAAVLTYIKLMLKMIRRKKFLTERLPDITRYLEIMETETARSGEIVKNLLSFSRHSKTIIGIHHISEILDKTLFLIQHDLLINNIRIVKQITPDLPPIKCDSKQIQQVLLNLVGNASSSMADGGILTVAANISQDKKILEVAISDTGCGITDKNLKNIFEPFFTTKEEGKGVGLGLSVAYGIIASHNGIVEVKTKLNEGSTFKICLPFPE